MAYITDTEYINWLMGMYMKATGLMVKNLVTEFLNGPTEMYTKVAGPRIKDLVMDWKNGALEVSMRATLGMV